MARLGAATHLNQTLPKEPAIPLYPIPPKESTVPPAQAAALPNARTVVQLARALTKT
jgi:hypothetical protein